MSLQSFRLPNPTALTTSRARKLFEDIQRKFQSRELISHDDIRSAVYESLTVAFTHAGEPTFEGAELLGNQPRMLRQYVDPIREIARDLQVAYDEARALTTSLSASFNFQQSLFEMLEGRAKRVGSTLIDLQIANDKFNEPVIVAGDDFTDNSRIDKDATITLPRADVQPLGGILTLQRTGNRKLTDPTKTTIRVEPLESYRYKLYEGQFYGLAGQAYPEGGRFNFVRQAPGTARQNAIPRTLLARFLDYYSGGESAAASTTPNQQGLQRQTDPVEGAARAEDSGSFEGFTKQDWEIIGANIHSGAEVFSLQPGERREFAETLDGSHVLVDQGATAHERLQSRVNLIDGDPETFWQVEYTRNVGTTAIDEFLQSGDENYPERVGWYSQFLQQRQRNFDALDLRVRIVVDLQTVDVLNWIDLVPLLFDGIEHVRVDAVETSIDGENYTKVPPLHTGESQSLLARDSNETLTVDEAKTVLAPNASAFAGRGLWAFAPRQVRFVRFDLTQEVPVLTPYEVVKVQLTRQVHRRHSRNAVGRRRSSSNGVETRTVALSYPESILATTGQSDPADLAKARLSSSVSSSGSRTANITTTENAAVVPGHLGHAARQIATVSRLAFGPGGPGGRTSYGNEQVAKQWTEVKWDQSRYAIGIRDLGLWQYEFAESSEYVSIPFQSPAPLRTLSLEADEVIPADFNAGQNVQSWINYYVAVGDSEDWLPIAPTTSRVVRTLEDGQVPSVIHVNSGIPMAERAPGEGYLDLDNEPTSARVRIVLRRPLTGQAPASFTPALKGYRLLMTVRGGLR
jgi:hypothetical protein